MISDGEGQRQLEMSVPAIPPASMPDKKITCRQQIVSSKGLHDAKTSNAWFMHLRET